MNVRTIARQALDQIAATDKGYIYASRKGIVAGVLKRNVATLFRRVEGSVLLEINDQHKTSRAGLTRHSLPADLEREAARMLDNL